ncbi:uncharacterized protein LOC125514392 [Triticum urartu]|uniref:uncharacterized protein LOC125514392 n=1 Tax=Triticum urartu TaxID=4572 RepID=UPI0020445361|nr:uncharacterized protein LOC125514392 [Triticum urartu]
MACFPTTGAPHGEEWTRSTPSFPTRYEKEEIGPRKLFSHIFMCRAEKNPNGELGMPSNVQVAFVLSSAVWSSSIALLARHLLGWSKSPCPRNSHHKLFTSPSKTKGTTSYAAVPKDPTQTGEIASTGDVVDPASKTKC